ncbi:hypothetical protein DEO48_26165 [Enterobacter sp. CGMCC 5087]|uniref:inverse autotransporter beta domain-containing protein n=1 Tax=Enterobacter sp. CGMCC 5087 TaxID=2183878 RepID=UPI000D672267|nr:inverse autotransporter beta domain-containing protein [Enterobacter sp. CGMCC 5087]PWI77090.1 hypothetical protein DEO48_26165 [Enterobacter sp. CGMCC 5087]
MYYRNKCYANRYKQALQTRLMKSVVLVNILVQVAFPLAVSVSPVIASATVLNGDPFGQDTSVYTLQKGETVQSVAEKFHISLPALRKLNQLRTFAHGFDHLQVGDELDVPETSLRGKKGNDVQADAGGTSDPTAQTVAGFASEVGGLLKNNHQGEAAASMGRGMATGAAGDALQQWLSHFGTARVQLNSDEKFSLKNSQFDLLVPWYEREDRVMFSQGSLHRTDDRTQGNLGLGTRWFNDGWMWGANTFMDYDFSHEHTRAGLGVEYWRDYLKLSANTYMRLSGWKDSKDLEDYQERPANGWDLRTEGYLPAWPQLGGTIQYEQYYGNSVALFGKDHRQRDPNSVTLGVNYTPFPLLTLNVDERQGKGGENDTRIGLSLNWQPGVPLSHQLDPDEINALRTLSGNRYDLVDRNNDIVLEYRKKESIKLQTAAKLSGYPGETKSLDVQVKASHGLDHITWSATALVAAGGAIVSDALDRYSVILPDTKAGGMQANTYEVSLVAYDRQGHHSKPAITTVTVNARSFSTAYSGFSPLSSFLNADGTSSEVLTLKLRDAQQQPIDESVDNIQIDKVSTPSGQEKSSSVSGIRRTSLGIYEVTVTAGKAQELLTLTPVVENSPLPPATVDITRDVPAPDTSSFGGPEGHAPETIQAGNPSGILLKYVAKDATGNPVRGIAKKLKFAVTDSNNLTPSPDKINVGIITETDTRATGGTYTATLTGNAAGHYTVTPQFYGKNVGESMTVNVSGDFLDEKNSSFIPTPAVIMNDGKTSSTLKLTAKNISDKPVQKGDVRFVVKNSHGKIPEQADITLSAVTDNGNGVYTATFASRVADTYTIVPEVSSIEAAGLSTTVTVQGENPLDSTKNSFMKNERYRVGGVEDRHIIFTAKDKDGKTQENLVPGLTFYVKNKQSGQIPDKSEVTIGTPYFTSDVPMGDYLASISGTKPGVYELHAKYKDQPVTLVGDDYTVTFYDDPDETQSTFRADKPTITNDGKDAITLRFEAKDPAGNLVPGLIVDTKAYYQGQEVTDSSNIALSEMQENEYGVYTSTVTAKTAAQYSIKLSIASDTAFKINPVNITVSAPDSDVNEGQSQFLNTHDAPLPVKQETTLRLELKDVNGNKVNLKPKDKMTYLVLDSNEQDASANHKITGIYSDDMLVYIKADKAGTYTAYPVLNGKKLSIPANFEVSDIETPDEYLSKLDSEKMDISSDSGTKINFKALSKNNERVKGLGNRVKFTAFSDNYAGNSCSVGPVNESSPGIYTATLTGKADTPFSCLIRADVDAQIETFTTRVSIGGKALDERKSSIQIIQDSPGIIDAVFNASDSDSHPVSGLKSVQFALCFREFLCEFSSGKEVKGGKYVGQFSLKRPPGVYTLRATLGGYEPALRASITIPEASTAKQ